MMAICTQQLTITFCQELAISSASLRWCYKMVLALYIELSFPKGDITFQYKNHHGCAMLTARLLSWSVSMQVSKMPHKRML